MQLLLAFVLGLLVQQSLQIDGFGGQSGNLFSLGGGAAVPKPAGPLFTNVGNVKLNSGQSGFGAAASPGFLGGAGGAGLAGLQGGGGYNPAFGGAGGFGQNLGFAGGFGQKLGFAGGFGQKLGFAGGFGQKQGFGGGYGLGGGHGFGGGHAFGGGIGSSLLGGGFKGGFGGPGGFQGGLPGAAFGFGGRGGHAGKKEAPLKLTCQNVDRKKTEYGYNEASIAATVMKTRDGGSSYGDFSDSYGKMSLSLDLTVKINGGKGPAKAKVVFTETAATSYGCDPYSLGEIFTGDNKDDSFGNLFGGSFFSGGYNDHDDGVVTTLSIYPDQTTSVHKDKLDIESLEHLAGRGLAIVTGVKKDAYGKNEIDGNVLACCALAYDDQPRSLNDGPKHPIGYNDGPKHPIGYDDGPKHPIGYDDGPKHPIGYDNGPKHPIGYANPPYEPEHPIGYDDPEHPIGYVNPPYEPKHPIGYDEPSHPIGYDDKPYDPRFDGPRRG